MRINFTLFLAVLFLSVPAITAGMPVLPASFDSGDMVRVEEPKTWTPDNMYEHVNGEAELLKRYGAIGLAYASYENKGGDYLSIDILDMTAPVNAFGLYSLYAGCDGDEYSASGARVLSGDYTSYAIIGRYFMRIDFETGGSKEGGRSLVSKFLSVFVNALPAPEPLPPAVDHLRRLARKPCETGYHPEHVDYDLEAGPGYNWVGPDGETCFLHFLPTATDTRALAAALVKKGVPTTLTRGSVVGWTKVDSKEVKSYLDKILSEAVQW